MGPDDRSSDFDMCLFDNIIIERTMGEIIYDYLPDWAIIILQQ